MLGLGGRLTEYCLYNFNQIFHRGKSAPFSFFQRVFVWRGSAGHSGALLLIWAFVWGTGFPQGNPKCLRWCFTIYVLYTCSLSCKYVGATYEGACARNQLKTAVLQVTSNIAYSFMFVINRHIKSQGKYF